MSNTYQQNRVFHNDGTWSDVSTVKFAGDALSFRNIILKDYQTRMKDIAHLIYAKSISRGEINPVIVLWACLEEDTTAHLLFPNLNALTDEGEQLISANSLITYTMRALLTRQWLTYDATNWQLNIPHKETIWNKRATQILGWLITHKRLHLEKAPNHQVTKQDFVNFNAYTHAIPVGRCGLLRQDVYKNRYQIAFNTSYFLLENDDFISHHSALGDAYNLHISEGDIVRPPIYRRSTIYRDSNSKWHIDRIGMQDIELHFSSDFILYHRSRAQDDAYSFEINPQSYYPISVYTRYFGIEKDGIAQGTTPKSDHIEFTIIDKTIVGVKVGGQLLIPQNGFVLSFAPKQLKHHVDNLHISPTVNYRLAGKFEDIVEAIQCGPRLIAQEQIDLDETTFDKESFWISRTVEQLHIVGVVPTDYPIDIAKIRAGRVGIGITADQALVIVAVSGVNAGYDQNNTDSMGATLVELATYLKDAGASDAVNLDGGGSTQLFYKGGMLTRFGDRRGLTGVIYDRMIPSIGVIP